MAQNIGTLVSAAIRPNDSLDPIASAYASEIRGGLHTTSNSTIRDNIIFERREWGMMCYVTADNKTYQLRYNYSSTNIMDNNNWVEFQGTGGSGGEWVDSVISVEYSQPLSPSNGDRYLVGLESGDVLIGSSWSSYNPGYIAEWNSSLTQWILTTPTDGMSVRVDDEDNCIYRYEGTFFTGQWVKESIGQVRSIDATFIGGYSYSTTTQYFTGYVRDMLFLTKFDTSNLGHTASLNVNGLGDILIKKPTPSGVTNINPSDILTDVVYSLVYDGTYFQLNRPYVNEELFNVKYVVESTDYIVVPQYYQYWVYGDLTIDGYLVNYGQVIIANGSLINNGTFSNYGDLAFVSLTSGGSTTSYNSSETIQFTQSNTIYGLSVSAVVANDSLTASHLNTGTNGGPTAGYALTVDSNGFFSWETIASGSTNGLSVFGDSVGLGGTLSQVTNIQGDGYDLTLGNLDIILVTGSVFDVEADGFISLDAGTGSVQILSDDSVVISGGTVDVLGTFSVNGIEIDPTSPISGYSLTYDGVKFKPQLSGSVTQGINGLEIIGSSSLGLGGTLSQSTTIQGDGYQLTLGNLDIILVTGSTLDIEIDGFVNIESFSTQLLSQDSISISANSVDILGTFSVNGVEIDPTSATSGYVLKYDGVKFKPQIIDTVAQGINGLEIIGSSSLGLGGTLSQMTNINGDGYDLIINNVDLLMITASTLDIEIDGFISIDAGTGSIQVIADDVIDIAANGVGVLGSFSVNGVEIDPTTPSDGYVLTYDGFKFVPLSQKSLTEITISGTQNGSNRDYVLSDIPAFPQNLFFINGLLIQEDGYIVSGTALSIDISLPAPTASDSLRFFGTVGIISSSLVSLNGLLDTYQYFTSSSPNSNIDINVSSSIDTHNITANVNFNDSGTSSNDVWSASKIMSDVYSVSLSGARANGSASDIYLGSGDGLPYNVTPYVLPFDGVIRHISLSTSDVATWTGEVRDNGVLISGASLTSTSQSATYSSFDINVNEGSLLQLYVNGTGVPNPRMSVIISKR